ncbi:hypothetical protein NBRC116597_40830 [Phaeobacter sp. NW0010-22]
MWSLEASIFWATQLSGFPIVFAMSFPFADGCVRRRSGSGEGVCGQTGLQHMYKYSTKCRFSGSQLCDDPE